MELSSLGVLAPPNLSASVWRAWRGGYDEHLQESDWHYNKLQHCIAFALLSIRGRKSSVRAATKAVTVMACRGSGMITCDLEFIGKLFDWIAPFRELVLICRSSS